VTARHALPSDPSLLAAAPRRVLPAKTSVPLSRTIVVATASLASVVAGCALILPLSGGQPLAVVSQRAASDAAQLAAMGTITPSVPATPKHLLTTSDTATPTPTVDVAPTVAATPSATAETPTPAKDTPINYHALWCFRVDNGVCPFRRRLSQRCE
jgi:hypothetical protein